MSRPALIWNIQEEHLDEAEFLLEMWAGQIDSPKHDLARLRDGAEARFLARVDGLSFGAERTLERLLLPALEEPDEDEFRTAAAAFTILSSADVEACEQLLLALERCEQSGESSESGPGLRGLTLALSLSPREGLIPWLARDIEAAHGPTLLGRVRTLAHHRVDAGSRLSTWLSAEDLELRRASAHLARYTGASEVSAALGVSALSDDAQLSGSAIESGLIRDLPGFWAMTCARALGPQSPRDGSPPARSALAWLAMLGDAAVHRQLLTRLDSPTAEGLWAAGLTGRPEAVDLAVTLLEHKTLARHAGELISTIAGLPRKHDRYWVDNGAAPVPDDPDEALPQFEDDDLDADLATRSEDSLRRPDPAQVRSWWASRRDRFDPRLRYSGGRVLDGRQLQRDLHEMPTRLRHARALELAARSAGLAQLQTRALTQVQTAQMAALGPLMLALDCQRGRPSAL